MNRLILLLASGIWILVSPSSRALIDENNNGLSDLWEQSHNNGDLFPETYDPQADPDQDGWTNAQEAAAGTDPNNPNPPAGIIAPDLLHIPAVMGTDGNGQPIIITPEVLTVSWPTLIGKQYTLLFSPDLTAASWLQVPQSTFIGDGNIHDFNFDLSSGDRCFWRVSVTDCDTDQDGLTDAEENTLDTNPSLADTDSDTIPDSEEVALGTDPADFDSDDDLITNAKETAEGTDMNDPDDFPPYWIWAENQVSFSSHKSFIDNTYSRTIGYRAWDLEDIADQKLQDLSSDFSPSDVVTERDALTLPQNAADAEVFVGLGYVWIDPVNSGAKPSSGATLYRNSGASVSSADFSATRCWLRVPQKEQPQQFYFLKHVHHTRSGDGDELAETISCEVLSVNIAANQTTSDPIDLTSSTTLEAGATHITATSLVSVEIEDNAPATGADAVSIRSATTDIGYQGKFWIMAPSGNAPDGSPCSNDMKFKIPFNHATNLNCYPPNPTPPAVPPPGLPSPVNVSLTPGPSVCSWHGNSTTTTETPEVDWKISSPGQQPGISVALPIGVKAMKRRTVKVALHEIVSVVPGVPNDAPGLIPSKAVAEEYLNQVFAYQINAWFDVTRLPPEPITFDTADAATYGTDAITPGNPVPVPGDRILSYRNWNSPEVSLATASRPNGYDIHVYVLGGATPFVKYRSTIADPAKIEVDHSGVGDSNLQPGANYCVIDGDRDQPTRDLDGNITGYQLPAKDRTPLAVLNTIAHEIGHIMIGDGHPDEETGNAPLLGTNRTLRLMCGGDNSDPATSVLLVKTEWDAAETWLTNRPNGDN